LFPLVLGVALSPLGAHGLNSKPSFGRTEGAAAVESDDAWVVGYTAKDPDEGPFRTLTMHWDGAAWATVPSPDPGDSNDAGLNAVTTVSATDAWAGGSYEDSGTELPLALHWDGSTWATVATAPPNADYEYFEGMSGAA
jgi:hypothetical protein